MIAEQNFTILNKHSEEIFCTLTPAESPKEALATIILVHGFKGFRNWGFFPFAAQYFAQRSYNVVRIDLAGNGMRGTNNEVVDLEGFAANTISHDVGDIESVLKELSSGVTLIEQGIQPHSTFILVGHSRGAGASLVAARNLIGGGIAIDRVVCWNSVGTWVRWTPRQQALWLAEGCIVVENSRTKQTLTMNATYVQDILNNKEALDLQYAVQQLNANSHRAVFIHAENDLTVPLKEIQQLTNTNNTMLHVIPHTTHTFGISHPVERITPAFIQALQLTSNLLQ